MDTLEISELSESVAVSERNKVDAMVSEGGEQVKDSGFLSSSGAGSGNESSGVLSVKSTAGPELSCSIEESLCRMIIIRWKLIFKSEKQDIP